MKSGNLNFLEPPGPLWACNRTALPFTISLGLLDDLWPPVHKILQLFMNLEQLMTLLTLWIIFMVIVSLFVFFKPIEDTYELELCFHEQFEEFCMFV